jgi:ABC-type molybdate transport system substrate-binding protein
MQVDQLIRREVVWFRTGAAVALVGLSVIFGISAVSKQDNVITVFAAASMEAPSTTSMRHSPREPVSR